MQDVVMSMLDEGCVAVVPIDTDIDPETASYKINTMRTGKIVEWFPEYVRVRLYNERLGRQDEITLPKKMVAIVENPLYAVINEPNSTMQRLIRKLNLLDVVDEQNSSGKLDLIIQLPYVIRTEKRREQAGNHGYGHHYPVLHPSPPPLALCQFEPLPDELAAFHAGTF